MEVQALQEALQEKQEHVESLLVERDLERSEMVEANITAAEKQAQLVKAQELHEAVSYVLLTALICFSYCFVSFSTCRSGWCRHINICLKSNSASLETQSVFIVWHFQYFSTFVKKKSNLMFFALLWSKQIRTK